MADPIVIEDAKGLNTQPNELGVPAGSLAVAENVEITRDGMIQVSPGFANFSSNMPAFQVDQLQAVGGQLYAFADSGWWYHDGTNWLRKRGVLGAKSTSPNGAVVLNGILYYTANNCVVAINLTTGIASVIAGRFGVTGTSDGTGDAARFTGPGELCTDGTSLFTPDNLGSCIRRIAAPFTAGAAVVTTIAGTSGAFGSADGTGAAASFNAASGLACDGTSIYVCDANNFTIRRIAPPLTAGAGVVTTIAGTAGAAGSTDATGAAARFAKPKGLTLVGTSLYAVDTLNGGFGDTIRRIAPPLTAGAGVVTTIAGTSNSPGNADGTGAVARFTNPWGITNDGTNLYVVDMDNHRIRKIAPPLTAGAGVVTTFAGSSSGSADGIGTAAQFKNPQGAAFDGTNLYVCDTQNQSIRKIYVSSAYVATVSGVAGAAANGPPAANADGIMQGPT